MKKHKITNKNFIAPIASVLVVFVLSFFILNSISVKAGGGSGVIQPLEPPVIFEPFVIPGTVEGVGTHFEVKDSEYLNIILDSTKRVKIRIESVPGVISDKISNRPRIDPTKGMIVIDIELDPNIAATLSPKTTQITISGFLPNTTYYKYEDGYENLVEMKTDSNGVYTYKQDITKPHLVFIQSQPSTKFIKDDSTGGDCVRIGIWDNMTKTCTLIRDVNETIQINDGNITMDGNGYLLMGSGIGYGIYLRSGYDITLKNIIIKNFSFGVFSREKARITMLKSFMEDNYRNNYNGNSLVIYDDGDNLYNSEIKISANINKIAKITKNIGNNIESNSDYFASPVGGVWNPSPKRPTIISLILIKLAYIFSAVILIFILLVLLRKLKRYKGKGFFGKKSIRIILFAVLPIIIIILAIAIKRFYNA